IHKCTNLALKAEGQKEIINQFKLFISLLHLTVGLYTARHVEADTVDDVDGVCIVSVLHIGSEPGHGIGTVALQPWQQEQVCCAHHVIYIVHCQLVDTINPAVNTKGHSEQLPYGSRICGFLRGKQYRNTSTRILAQMVAPLFPIEQSAEHKRLKMRERSHDQNMADEQTDSGSGNYCIYTVSNSGKSKNTPHPCFGSQSCCKATSNNGRKDQMEYWLSRKLCGMQCNYRQQAEGDLGTKLKSAVKDSFSRGNENVFVIGIVISAF
ncbi:hypothetical protein MAR_011338, partial [Mya arenaria]